MNNLVSTCYVIERSLYIEPVIYLHRPEVSDDVKVHVFDNPFTAKSFIQYHRGVNSKVVIAKSCPKLSVVNG